MFYCSSFKKECNVPINKFTLIMQQRQLLSLMLLMQRSEVYLIRHD